MQKPGPNVINKWSITIIILLTAFIGYVAMGPFLTMQNIQKGLSNKNTQILENNIDFETLRASIKTQINQQMAKTVNLNLGGTNNPMAQMAEAFLSQAVDKIVDYSLTPEGLANLMKGKPKQKDEKPASEPSQENDKPRDVPQPADDKATSDNLNALDNADMTYDSLSQSSFWITNSKGQKTRIVFTRYGIRWKLSDIILPQTYTKTNG